MLHEFVTANREEIIGRCRKKVTARSPQTKATAETSKGIPVFLDQLVTELLLGLSDSPAISHAAIQHGDHLLRQGYTVSEVVHDYGDVCQAITEMAVERNTSISSDDFRMLNHCLDDAIAGAVTEYARKRDDPSAKGIAGEESKPLTVLARALANSIDSASVAFEAIKSGHVGAAGSTGTVLEQNLKSARDLTERLLVMPFGAETAGSR